MTEKNEPRPDQLKAVGCFKGRLKFGSNYVQFIAEDWETVVQAIGPQVACRLQEGIEEGYFTIWPRPRGIELRTLNSDPHPALDLGIMKICGRINWMSGDLISLQVSDRHRIAVIVKGYLPNVRLRQIWKIEATREGEDWAILDAELIKDAPENQKKKPKATAKPEAKVEPKPEPKPEPVDNVVPIRKGKPIVSGKLEVTIKFSELPEPTEVDGKMQIMLDCGGQSAIAAFSKKTWKKNAAKMSEYPQWVAAISGKIGGIQNNVIMLENPGIQVFEKKVKEVKEAIAG